MAASPYPVGGARLWWVLQDLEAGSKHLSHALFLALVAGMFMGVLMETAVDPILTLFMGAKSASIVPVTKVYVQIRSLAWPAILLAMVAQAALLATHEVWRPLRTVLWSSLLNLVLTLLLVNHFNQGIAGAAWATLASQYLAAVMHLNSLATQGVFGQLAPHVPTLRDLGTFVSLAGPVCVIIVARVVTYSLMSYTATSYGMEAIAAHQVMIGVFGMLQVFGEPLSQAAQAILPHFLNGPAAEALAAKNSFRRRRKRTSGTVATPQAKGAAMGSVASNRVPAAAAAAATVGSLSRRSESARSVPVEERDPVATQAPDGNGVHKGRSDCATDAPRGAAHRAGAAAHAHGHGHGRRAAGEPRPLLFVHLHLDQPCHGGGRAVGRQARQPGPGGRLVVHGAAHELPAGREFAAPPAVPKGAEAEFAGEGVRGHSGTAERLSIEQLEPPVGLNP
eukprot:jgi/Mesvir1/2416/Mv22153-RA.2